jgi:hypothetical protein
MVPASLQPGPTLSNPDDREPNSDQGASHAKWLATACLAVVLALYVVGLVSHESLRHALQTLPVWIAVDLGYRDRELAKWAALPCLIFWLTIMILIWLYLLGWSHIVRGHFSPIEISMTLVAGAASLSGLAATPLWKTSTRPRTAIATFLLTAAFQLLAFRLSLLPAIANR